ncbi:hypothetical protein [Lignipirellula cremea]|uniref:Uncharacterized protein n=1 Tax=Lignipirellula cremea TaxID=2528010 RepID=A0A518DVU8_9BACT|nr:hypothetical protein [Lignipirellula cremea]QDU95943.1 hypothetical protein Pla8534_37620 [Lignipirellula cremea]
MQFSIRDLMLLPVLVLAAGPVVGAASSIGLYLGPMVLPEFITNLSEIRHWFIDRGFSIDFVTGHVVFFVNQIPTILVLVLFAVFLFAMRTRVCDQAAVVTIASLPFVEAIQIHTMSEDFGVDNLGWRFLATQPLTGLTLAVIIVVYVLARRKYPNPIPTRTRVVTSGLSLAAILAFSVAVWM